MKNSWTLEVESKNEIPTLAEIEMAHIWRVYALADGEMVKTARLLGIGRTTLYRKIKVRPWGQGNSSRKKKLLKSPDA